MSAKGFGKVGAWLVGAVCAAVVGCAAQTRQVTYPPDFSYLTKAEIKDTMWNLAFHVRELDAALKDQSVSIIDNNRVVGHLEGMLYATAELDSDAQTNHPHFEHMLPMFERDVALALDAAKKVPPRYFLAHNITGACLYCHRQVNAPKS